MANNRLILLHRPTGYAVIIATRTGDGWSHSDTIYSRLDTFFQTLDRMPDSILNQDRFALIIEDAEHAPGLSDDWHYDIERDPLKIITEDKDHE